MTETFAAFNAQAAAYDAWYDRPAGRAIFATEVACLRPFLLAHPWPYLEVGVGSGRFAQALGIEYGVDPARGLLRLGRPRGIEVVQGVGEELPFAAQSFGAVLIAFTLCFVQEPARVLAEAKRVLWPGGGLVLGFIPGGSPWARYYTRCGAQGHAIYRHAHFYSREEVDAWLKGSGFQKPRYRSTLFQPPGRTRYLVEVSVAGYHERAGFVTLACPRTTFEYPVLCQDIVSTPGT